jgi:hypothetical protein
LAPIIPIFFKYLLLKLDFILLNWCFGAPDSRPFIRPWMPAVHVEIKGRLREERNTEMLQTNLRIKDVKKKIPKHFKCPLHSRFVLCLHDVDSL